jgi:hypothetical protein
MGAYCSQPDTPAGCLGDSKRFLDSLPRISFAKLGNPTTNEPLEKKVNKKNIKILGEISKEEAFGMDSDSDIITKINEFKTKGISVLEHIHEKTLTKMIETANIYYYNENPLLSDNEFDIINLTHLRQFTTFVPHSVNTTIYYVRSSLRKYYNHLLNKRTTHYPSKINLLRIILEHLRSQLR